MKRTNISSGSPFEPLRGYSRCVVLGDTFFLSGTTSIDSNGEIIGEGDPYAQTTYILQKLKAFLNEAGFALTDVVRTRLYVTNMTRWDDFARAHREFFEKIRPSSSIVQVARLVDPRLLIELEAEAIRGASEVKFIEMKKF